MLDITSFILMTKDMEPIVPDDPTQELLNDILCGMTAENHRRKAS